MSLRVLDELARPARDGDGAYSSAGSVRDLRLGRDVVDVDLVVADDPAAAARSLARTAGGAPFPLSDRHGAWRVVLRRPHGRHQPQPRRRSSPTWARRDFTINAMAVPVAGGDVIDPHGGRVDLAEGGCGRSPSRSSPTTRCGCCAWPGWPTSSGSPSTRRPSGWPAATLTWLTGRAASAILRRDPAAARARPPRRGHPPARPAGRPRRRPARGGRRCAASSRARFTISTCSSTRCRCSTPPPTSPPTPSTTCAIRRAASRRRSTPRSATGSTRDTGLRLAVLFHDIEKPSTRTVSDDGRVGFMGHDRLRRRDDRARPRAVAGVRTRLIRFCRVLVAEHLRLGLPRARAAVRPPDGVPLPAGDRAAHVRERGGVAGRPARHPRRARPAGVRARPLRDGRRAAPARRRSSSPRSASRCCAATRSPSSPGASGPRIGELVARWPRSRRRGRSPRERRRSRLSGGNRFDRTAERYAAHGAAPRLDRVRRPGASRGPAIACSTSPAGRARSPRRWPGGRVGHRARLGPGAARSVAGGHRDGRWAGPSSCRSPTRPSTSSRASTPAPHRPAAARARRDGARAGARRADRARGLDRRPRPAPRAPVGGDRAAPRPRARAADHGRRAARAAARRPACDLDAEETWLRTFEVDPWLEVAGLRRAGGGTRAGDDRRARVRAARLAGALPPAGG